ncbi:MULTISPECIES: GerAB/ArcD/ProY family transporter [Lysinibacillus]|uniref:Spore germination protein IB n=4 Tax=Lysinibacillus TaxID=400634 RepID=A0AAJ4ZU98_LYSSH|nr:MULTISPECIES: GerAB/ArcD/ProY family transporter [Lysinibacillus]AHN21346.1 spore germination protein [Lysinibacillus varians]MED4545590.1 GerAB/ArcD/ProY family transporter [Lysinibacillus sphaericus]GEC82391.1 germination protein GerHB [Lysinibacillus sphaericus]SUV16543.1 spore germination protein IB [Lysinibacillus sphaericus]
MSTGKSKKKLLNAYHVVFLAQSVMIGTGILSLPQQLSSLGYSQALMPLIFGVIASVTLYPMIWINSKFPNDNLFRINEILLGKWLGKCINLFFVIQFLVFIAGIISNYMHLIQSTALQEQTITGPVFCFLLLLIYIVSGGIKSIARFCIMTFFLTIGFLYFTHWAFEKGDMSHFLPLFNFFSVNDFYEALKRGYLSVLGYELVMFYFPYIVDQKKAFRHSLIGIWISILLCFITTAISVMYYSEWQLEYVEFSVLNLFKAGEFSFIERIDIFGITLWVFLILSTVAAYLWCAKKGVETLVSKKSNVYLYILVAIIFFVVKMPSSREFQDKLFTSANYVGYMLILWPVLLMMVYVLRKKKQVQV